MFNNQTQQEAIDHNKGPMMVLAGPGSGKTTVITYRTKKLIEEYKVTPRNILVITFSKASAEEMKERFLNICGDDSVTFGTFHSVFFRIIRQTRMYKVDNVLSEDKKYPILLKIIKSLNVDYEDENELIHSILQEISYIKSELIEIEHYHSISCSNDVFREVFNIYERFKEERNLIDFDDMLEKCYQLLKNDKRTLEYWQKKFQYILIDEFQDINRIQYECIKLLSRPNNNLFVVGDDDQAIYEFRGAKPDFLLNFPKDFENTKKVVLSTNYRSTKEILKASLDVIDHNERRYSKELDTPNKQGEKPVVLTHNTIEDEADYIIESIKKKSSKIALSEMAIIYRTNMQGRFFIERLMDSNIPFIVRDQMSNIYEHWIAKDFIAYFTLTQNIKDIDALTRIINKPNRYINKDNLIYAKKFSDNIWEGLYNKYNHQSWMVDRLEELQYHLQTLKRLPPYDGIEYLRKNIGYDAYICDYAEFRKVNDKNLIEIAVELQESAKNYKSLDEWLNYIEHYTVELKENYQNKKHNKNALTLTTIHSAKGLEFHSVYLCGCNEGILPHEKSNDELSEEERRLFYVGVTRAKEELYISSFKERFNKKLEPSRYIQEMVMPITNLQVGKEIKHQQFGIGRIEKVEKDMIFIFFYMSKKLVKLSISHCLKNNLISV
ncbi:DNA helicase-2/ATP-dependent DNA helicase PcrA [Natranaerovirga pectinivora]|uniref:DNA 3'-5' helicase n=1 Tax=Natranaerovirga pectinivora TaxID=682400 RepID=A0A4R3MMR8_9FIRM|nr:ATP-dependent helicase [Natranaerovirga pectinivora]TCT16265.1 DNA helicase-2/ATP-dependent DNA helicase PcrA [Natranaerovirga pectinivora]